MIQKIQRNEYLKRVDNMTAAEKDVYMTRVGEWLQKQAPILLVKAEDASAQFTNVTLCSGGWNDAECEAWTDGARLLSALTFAAETWLPDMLYVKAARRCIGRMVSVLTMFAEEGRIVNADTRNSRIANPSEQPSSISHQTHPQPLPNGSGVTSSLSPQTSSLTPQTSSLTPVRPRHIDQYVHLLPKATQERAEKYGPLMRELDEMREKERLLLDADGVSDKDREAVAKRIVAIDKEIGGIRKELDAEWNKLVESGRVVVDDLGNAHVKPTTDPSQVGGEDGATEATELTSEQKARRRELRKFLTDTRRGNGSTRDEHVAKWQENWKEYLTLEPREAAMKDEKILAAMEHYGIDLGTLNIKH